MRFWGYGQSHAISCRTTTTLRFFAARTAASSTRLSDPRLFYSVCSTQKFPGGAASIYLGSLGHSAGSCPDGFTLRGMQRRQVSLGQCWRGVQRTACQHHQALLGLSAAGCTWKCLKVSTHFTVDWWWSGCEGGGLIRVPEGSCCSTRSIMPPVSVNEESTCNWHLWVAMSTLGFKNCHSSHAHTCYSGCLVHRSFWFGHVGMKIWITKNNHFYSFLTILRSKEFWRCCSCRKLYWEGGAWCRSMRAAGAAWTGGPTDEEKCVAGATWKGHRVVLDGCDVLCQIGNGHQSIGGIYCIYIYISIIHTIFWPWHIWYALRGMGVFSSMETPISGL